MSNPESDSFKQREVVIPSELREWGIEQIDPAYTITLEDERDENNDPITGRAFWVRLKVEDGETIEGKLFLPLQTGESRELIIYNPGFPGDGVVLFDKRHAPNFIKEGYAVFVSRHNGLRAQGDGLEKYIHSGEKQGWSTSHGQEQLGEEPMTFANQVREPLIAAMALQQSFAKLHMIGHSAGGLNSFYSIGRLREEAPAVAGKIATCISLTGFVGRPRDDGTFDPLGHFDRDGLREYFTYVENLSIYPGFHTEERISEIEIVKQALYEPSFRLPDHLRVRFLAPQKDEFFVPGGANDFAKVLENVKEVSGLSYLDDEPRGMIHDMETLRTEELIEFIKGTSPSVQKLIDLEKS